VSIADSVRALHVDEWREANGFSVDMAEPTESLLAAQDDASRAGILGRWLERNQPCIFGQIAARHNFLSYCFLTEDILRGPDAAIRDRIQSARLAWKRDAEAGHKSGFIIAAISRELVSSAPDSALLRVAKEIASLYLLHEIAPDRIYTDTVRLVQPTEERPTWEWLVGVNFFGAQGDRRWWLDHRIPGGVAFSMNSVGHMVKAHMLADAMTELADAMGTEREGPEATRINSLERALTVAMHTIANAQVGPSGKSTSLLPLNDPDATPRCPVSLPARIAGFDHRTYRGFYHTDQTLPSAYFLPDVDRPASAGLHELDFTYLYDDSIDNPEYLTMGVGLRVRLFGGPVRTRRLTIKQKRAKAQGRPV
jgi:hypothetical protein